MTDQAIERARALLAAAVTKHGSGEIRPQQEKMVEVVAHALEAQENLVVQAGTGVGKSIGYLVPAMSSGRRAVVSTATNQLSDQLTLHDVPFVASVLAESGVPAASTASLKGRANYVCLRKADSLMTLDSQAPGENSNQGTLLSEIPKRDPLEPKDAVSIAQARGQEAASIISWTNEVGHDGDRAHAPVVSDETWRTLSSTPAECVGRAACAFGEACFAERARERASKADLVVTNHALVATELNDIESPWQILGDRDVVIFDEVHELDNQLSSAWGCLLNAKTLRDFARNARRNVPASYASARDAIESIDKSADKMQLVLDESEARRITSDDGWGTEIDNLLREVYLTISELSKIVIGNFEKNDARATVLLKSMTDILNSMSMLLNDSDDMVRWVGVEDGEASLSAAPLRIGPRLQSALEKAETTMIATSATIRVGSGFDIAVRNLALDETPTPHTALDVGTPFDYPRQAILYIPSPDEFPAPIGAERFEHNEATLEGLVSLVKAAGGRTLALSTTSAGARRMAERLREEVSTPVISQFDGPAAQVTKQFAEEEQSTLCATMGMWHGLNVPGRSLSLVVIDKIPFGQMNHPLTAARIADADARGASGFMDVYVADATHKLAQGFGRVVRTMQDKGMIAIFDTRIWTKRYGRTILNSLPDAWATNNQEVAVKALTRLLAE